MNSSQFCFISSTNSNYTEPPLKFCQNHYSQGKGPKQQEFDITNHKQLFT
jgi:hypothetical protein